MTTPIPTHAELTLSLKVQVATAYLQYLDNPKYADDADGIAWTMTRLASIITAANACDARGPVVRGVGAEMMERLWGRGLDRGIEAKKGG
jgi:hypothetical protein